VRGSQDPRIYRWTLAANDRHWVHRVRLLCFQHFGNLSDEDIVQPGSVTVLELPRLTAASNGVYLSHSKSCLAPF
jgi:hypothetical protein